MHHVKYLPYKVIPYNLILVIIILSIVFANVSAIDKNAKVRTADEFYDYIMVPYTKKYHEIGLEMVKMLTEDPVDDFIANDELPILRRIEYLADNVTTALASNGTHQLQLLKLIRQEDDYIREQLQFLDIKHKANIDLRDERKDSIQKKIKNFLNDLRKAKDLQYDLEIDDELDEDYAKQFQRDKLNITTPYAIEQYKKSLKMVMNLASKQDPAKIANDLIKETFGDREYHDPYEGKKEEPNKYDVLYDPLIQLHVERELGQLTPSNLIPKMYDAYFGSIEEFDTKLYWKYDAMSKKYMTHATDAVVNKFNSVIENMNKLEAEIEREYGDIVEIMERTKPFQRVTEILDRDEL